MTMIPIKCFTCGNVLADKYRFYKTEVDNRKKDVNTNDNYKNVEELNKTIEGVVLDELLLNNVCCRRHMLTHVDIV